MKVQFFNSCMLCTLKTGSERAGLWSMTGMAQFLMTRPEYRLKPSGILLELELESRMTLIRTQVFFSGIGPFPSSTGDLPTHFLS